MQTASYFRLEGPYLRLEGQRCCSCGKVQFPPRVVCRTCRSPELEIHEIARTGTVASFSEISSPPEGFSSPLIAALVALDDGLLLACQLTDVDFDRVSIGMPVEMVTRLISETGPEGCLVYGYKFRPRLV
ncbi:MAG: Zn-ribbon domain-containing OB-fold protein [Polyangiaceae bacterium]